MSRNAWPVVAIVTAAMACVTILAVCHAASSDLLTLISAAVIPTVTMLLIGGQLSGQVSEVKSQVNGRMSELIAQRERAVSAAQLAGLPPAAQEILLSTPPPAGPLAGNPPATGGAA
jgi:hypothetical protein